MSPLRHRVALLCAALLAGNAAWAQDALIRKNLSERLPNLPKIEEISKTPIPGIYEVRIGNEILYSDEQGNYLIQGNLIDTKTRADLTEARQSKLSAIDFASLPLKDALVWKQGTGARRVVVFADPNCGYCKRFERDLQQVKDVTVCTFLIPILGGDSPEKSRNIWCAKDKGKAWQDWMVRDQATPSASCDTGALARNIEFGKKYKIGGTPTLVFADGSRVPGAVSAQQVEKLLADAK